MKKRIKTLAFISTLLLFSCQQRPSEASESSSNNSEKISEPASEPVSEPVSEKQSETEESTTIVESEEEKRQREYENLWGEEISLKMKEHLNCLIPFPEKLGISNPQATWVRGEDDYYLEVELFKGTEDNFYEAFVNSMETYFSVDGYTVTADGVSKVTAVKEKAGIEVILEVEEFTSTLKCYYAEEFNPDYEGAAWPESFTEAFSTLLYGESIPYFYTGTKSPEIILDVDSAYSFYISGGYYDERIIPLAQQAFSADSYEVDTTAKNDVLLKATKAFDDFSLTCTLAKTSSSKPRVELRVRTMKKYSTEGDLGVWDEQTQDTMREMFTTTCPYFYLGVSNPVLVNKQNANVRITLSGSDYDETALTSIESQLQNDENYTLTKEETTYNGKKRVDFTLINNTTFDTWKIGIYSDKSLKLTASIEYLEHYSKSKENGVYSQKILDAFNSYTASNQVPYVFVGTAVSVSHIANSNTLGGIISVIGGQWSDEIIDDATFAYINNSNATWTVDKADKENDIFQAHGTFQDGTKFTSVTIKNNTATSHINMTIEYLPKFEALATNWTDETKSKMETNMHGHILPFVYLNDADPNAYYNASTSTFSLTGGYYREEMFTQFLENYSAEDGWEVVETTTTLSTTDFTSYTASKTFSDGCSMNLQIYPIGDYYNPRTRMDVKYSNYYDPTKATDWTDKTKSTMRLYFDEVIPYIYLGTDDPKVTYNSAYNSLTIKGGTFSTAVYDQFRTSLENDNLNYQDEEKWAFEEGKDAYGDYLLASREKNDGSKLTLIVSPSTNVVDNQLIKLEFFKEEKKQNTATDWSINIKETMKNHLGGHTLPYLNIGEDDGFTKIDCSTINYYTLTASSFGAWDSRNLDEAEKALADEGYTVTKTPVYPYGSKEMKYTGVLDAEKTFSEGDSIQLRFYRGNLLVKYTPAYSLPQNGSWSEEISQKMSMTLNGNILPYFYLGSSEIEVGEFSSSSNCTLKGSTWNDKMFDDIKAAFASDTQRTWAVGTDYTTLNETTSETIFFVAEDPSSPSHHITVKLVKKTTTDDLPLSYPQVTILYN